MKKFFTETFKRKASSNSAQTSDKGNNPPVFQSKQCSDLSKQPITESDLKLIQEIKESCDKLPEDLEDLCYLGLGFLELQEKIEHIERENGLPKVEPLPFLASEDCELGGGDMGPGSSVPLFKTR